MKRIDVTCAVIIRDGFILITQRGADMDRAGKWEFPGGKVKNGELPEACIVREIKEELNIDISVKEWLKHVEYSYPDIEIRLIPCIAEITGGTLKLNEHSEYEWAKKEELLSFDLVTADVAVVEQVVEML
jgi:8-oxo-dGTP diphosphatase